MVTHLSHHIFSAYTCIYFFSKSCCSIVLLSQRTCFLNDVFLSTWQLRSDLWDGCNPFCCQGLRMFCIGGRLMMSLSLKKKHVTSIKSWCQRPGSGLLQRSHPVVPLIDSAMLLSGALFHVSRGAGALQQGSFWYHISVSWRRRGVFFLYLAVNDKKTKVKWWRAMCHGKAACLTALYITSELSSPPRPRQILAQRMSEFVTNTYDVTVWIARSKVIFYKNQQFHQHRPQTATNHVSTTFMCNKEVIGGRIPEKRNERTGGDKARNRTRNKNEPENHDGTQSSSWERKEK